jgi:hypothetical protein
MALSGASGQGYRAIARFRAFSTPIVLDTLGILYDFEAPVGSVFEAAERAAQELKLRVAFREPTSGMLGNLKWVRSASIAGEQASRFLDCGGGVTGPIADRDRLTLAWGVLLEPHGLSRTRGRLALVGEALDMSGHAADPAACFTTGVLEKRLAELVTRFLASP